MGYSAGNFRETLIGSSDARLQINTNELPVRTEYYENNTGLTYILDDSRNWTLYKDTSFSGLSERLMSRILKSLNVDSSGRLRVAAESVANISTITTVTTTNTVSAVTTLANITNWGLRTATALTQQESYISFQQGYRRNLVHS